MAFPRILGLCEGKKYFNTKGAIRLAHLSANSHIAQPVSDAMAGRQVMGPEHGEQPRGRDFHYTRSKILPWPVV